MRIHDLASVDLHPSTNALSRLPSKRLEAIFVNAAPHSVLNVELASYSSKTFVIDLDRDKHAAATRLWSDAHLANHVVPRSLRILALDEDGREEGTLPP